MDIIIAALPRLLGSDAPPMEVDLHDAAMELGKAARAAAAYADASREEMIHRIYAQNPLLKLLYENAAKPGGKSPFTQPVEKGFGDVPA